MVYLCICELLQLFLLCVVIVWVLLRCVYCRGKAPTRSGPPPLLFSSGLFILKSIGVCCCVCTSLRLLHSVGENKGALALAGPDCSH